MNDNQQQGLVPIEFKDDGSAAVSMRALHAGLDVSTSFTDWAKRMFAYGFDEGTDYAAISLPKNGERVHGGQNRRDWALTIDTAKEIAMLQRSERGQQVRRYFIAAEKALREARAPELSDDEIVHQALTITARKVRALEAVVERQRPAVEYHERFVAESDDVLTIDNFASQFGSTGPKVRDLLVDKHIAVRRRVGAHWSAAKRQMVEDHEWRPAQGKATSGWFELRPQHNAPRLHNGQVRQTLYVRQFYAWELAARLGLTVPTLDIA